MKTNQSVQSNHKTTIPFRECCIIDENIESSKKSETETSAWLYILLKVNCGMTRLLIFNCIIEFISLYHLIYYLKATIIRQDMI